MKKYGFMFFLYIMAASAYADIGDPFLLFKLFNGGFARGVSEPKSSEAEAILDAKNSALREMAGSIASYISAEYKTKTTGTGTNTTDITVETESQSSLAIRLPLTGISEISREIERREGMYIARIVITISLEGLSRAREFAGREAVSFRAFNFFAQKITGLKPASLTDIPEAYPDFYSWLQGSCMIMTINSSEQQDAYWEQMDWFLYKLSRNIYTYADRLDNKPVRIIFDGFRHLETVKRALKNQFTFTIENAHIVLTPMITPGEFVDSVQEMPDAGEIIIAGIYDAGEGKKNMDPVMIDEIAGLVQKHFEAEVSVFALPDTVLSGNSSGDQLCRGIKNGPARYILLFEAKAVQEPAILSYHIAPYYRLSYTCMLYDALAETKFYGKTINDGIFEPVSDSTGYSRTIFAGLPEILNSLLKAF
jgi:hypothetical protein